MKASLRKFYRLRDENGYLINRCNRCGEKLEGKRYFAGKEPICKDCVNKINVERSRLPKKNEVKEIQPSKRYLMRKLNGKHNWHQHRSVKEINKMFEKIKEKN